METENKIKASLVVLFYNQKDFVKDALQGALSQTYDNLEIIISDDASPDGTFEEIKKYLSAHHTDKKVVLNHNERNMGLVPHLNYLMANYVQGDVVALAGGDDVSCPDRISETVKIFKSDSAVYAVTGQIIVIDKHGAEQAVQPTKIPVGSYCMDDAYIRTFSFMHGGFGLAFRRKVWDTFGELNADCPTEDSTIRFRTLLLGKGYVAQSVFIKYRVHGNNLSNVNNIFNLKTARIAEQYRCDLKKAEELQLIDPKTEKRLRKKIWYYVKERNLAATKQGLPRLLRAPYKFIQLILNRKVDRI